MGYQFSPRLADVGESRFWRMDASADYGVLNGLARQTINRNLIEQNWDDLFETICELAKLKMHWPAIHPHHPRPLQHTVIPAASQTPGQCVFSDPIS
jgi:hypothetical protein